MRRGEESRPKGRRAELRRLARSWGLVPEYVDVHDRPVTAPDETLLAALCALGAPLVGPEDVPSALRARREEIAGRVVSACQVAWDGRLIVPLRLPAASPPKGIAWRLELEHGEEREGIWTRPRREGIATATRDGRVRASFELPEPVLPTGYHRLVLSVGDREHTVEIIAAPSVAWGNDDPAWERAWGVFLPLHALRSRGDWGAGDLTRLGSLLEGVRPAGGRIVGTLPLLASFLDEPFEPSPYMPASRRFWNELYVDVEQAPELARCAAARARIDSRQFLADRETLRSGALVDYRELMALKRGALELLARSFFTDPHPERQVAFRRFISLRPEVGDYASFRAMHERERRPWQQWDERSRNGTLPPPAELETARSYHLYAQWIAEEQIAALAKRAGETAGYYLDLPVGVHPQGYDAWRDQESFVFGMRVGAPPDTHFTKGQNWGFPPLHPERARERGHRHFRECIVHHLRHARVLRLDHVMSLWRLFWIPSGFEPAQGVYARYPAEEHLAVLSIESHRHRAVVVGEDLGTVPPAVRPALARHGIRRMFILQRELDHARESLPLDGIPPRSFTGMNTHDMPPFAGFWTGRDIEDRRRFGLLDESSARLSLKRRREVLPGLERALGCPSTGDATERARRVLHAALLHLRRSSASFLLLNLEDLWLETEPQNLPGTSIERPNWRRKARLTLEEILGSEEIRALFERIERAR